MAFLTKQQVKDAIIGRPAGSSPEQVVNELLSRGHQLEGLDMSADTPNQAGAQAFNNTKQSSNIIGGGGLQGQSNANDPTLNLIPQSVKNVSSAVGDWATKTQQTNAQNKSWGNLDVGSWVTQEIPAVVANATNALGRTTAGAYGIAKNAIGLADGVVTGKGINSEYLQGFGDSANEAWGGALDIIGSPLPLLPDFVEKPLSEAVGAGMETADYGVNTLLNAFGVPEGSGLNRFIRQASQNVLGTAMMLLPGRAKGKAMSKGMLS